MSFWFITPCIIRSGPLDAAVLIPSNGLPDLSRALSREHLREWVKHLRGKAAPELVDSETDRNWQLISAIHRDDYVIILKDEATLALGEIVQDYRFESAQPDSYNVWPVRWISLAIPLASFPLLRAAAESGKIKEIADSEARILFRTYLPSMQTRFYLVFRWVSVIILVAELLYFWPGK